MTIHWANLDTAGKIEAIKAVYVPGITMELISERAGTSYAAVRGMYRRCRDRLADCPLNAVNACIDWSAEEKQRIADYLRAGMSGRQIAELTGRSRNAILGKVNRDKELKAIGFARGRGESAGAARPKTKVARRRKPPRLRIVCAPIEEPVGLMLMDLERNHCRWPVSGDGAHTQFCGHPKHDGSSYCAGHHVKSRSLKQAA